MVSTWSSELTFQPTTYGSEEKVHGLQNHLGFTFIDFLPACRDPGGLLKNPVYDSFRTILDTANEWLRANRQWEITTCESVEFSDSWGRGYNTDNMLFIKEGDFARRYIRGLRLWLTERKENNDREQQIGYINLIPRQTEPGGIFHQASFETLDEVIHRFNSMMKSDPIPGRVLTIETQEMKLPESLFSNIHELDPDRSAWLDYGNRYKHFLFVIRIFYEITTGSLEEIGVKDFIPYQLAARGIISLPKHEPFYNIVRKASDWCAQQQGIRFCNAQSFEVKFSRESSVNTQKMNYIETKTTLNCFLKVLRVAYTIPPASLYPEVKNQLTELTCRTFIPVQLTASLLIPQYETLEQTRGRVAAWVKATGARVLSAETSGLRILTGLSPEDTVRCSREMKETWIYVIRLYFHGVYQEPPQEMLPPVPVVQSRNCCVIL